MKKIDDWTWEDVIHHEPGFVYRDAIEYGGVRVLIQRGQFSVCAYLGVPFGHPLAGFDYDDIPLEVHGGWTFSKAGDGEGWPSRYWWYGWDYAHAGDESALDSEGWVGLRDEGKRWLPRDVNIEAIGAAYGFKKLMTLMEKACEYDRPEKEDGAEVEVIQIDGVTGWTEYVAYVPRNMWMALDGLGIKIKVIQVDGGHMQVAVQKLTKVRADG